MEKKFFKKINIFHKTMKPFNPLLGKMYSMFGELSLSLPNLRANMLKVNIMYFERDKSK